MSALPSQPEIVIVGAGAAGIGAGVALARLGVPFLVLEAKDRVGGRAYSEAHSLGSLWDHGCHWFHSAEINPLREIADRLGHPYRPTVEAWHRHYAIDGRLLGAEEFAALQGSIEAAFADLDAAGARGEDRPASEVVDLAPPAGIFVRSILEAVSSAPLEELSTLDSHRYQGSEVDYAVTGGYGALVARLATGLPVRLSTPVTGARRSAGGVVVATPAGEIMARAAIITVSNNVLASGRLALEREVEGQLAGLLAEVPCGHCEKIALELSGPAWADDKDLSLRIAHRGQALGVQIRPYGRPIVTSYLSGSLARQMGSASDAEAGAYLTERLVECFGAGVRRSLGRARTTRWGSDPHVLGAYSYVRPGRAASRERLIAADLAPIYLAGEAMLLDHYSTAHGAWLSGQRTAHRAAEALGHAAKPVDPTALP